MCGICGFVSRENITVDQLTEMNDTMYHRGPNDSGVEVYPFGKGYTVGLAQRRLSILDLSPLGHQPMHSVDKRVSIVFNGEIYNFKEIKQQLSDYSFQSSCDTEVILAAYMKWGIDCIKRLNGMFAIAILDREKETLYLVRDRIGKKPLYYSYIDGNLMFASELKPIMKYKGFQKKINERVLPRYLYQQYISGEETIFEEVYRLGAGQVLTFSKEGLKKERYWDLPQVYQENKRKQPGSFEEAKAGLKERLETAVAQRMIADVPLGTFLSGGYDSSLVTAIAQSLSKEPVKTFAIGFTEKKYNEAVYAKEVAEYLGCEHTELYIGEKDMFDLIESVPRYYDEPFADSSQIPSMLVAQLAKSKVTVALSGDGGDEFFCGYNVYDKVLQAQRLDWIGAVAGGIGNMLHITEKYPFKVRVIAGNRNREAKTQFIAGNYRKTAENIVRGGSQGKLPVFYDFETKYGEKNWQERRMLLDMETYLPEDILCKVDRATMKYSLEARCPILDTNVMEYAFRLPHEYKYGKGMKKRILKELAYDYIPREMLEREKTGFSVPLDKWLRGPLKEQVLDFAGKEYLNRQGLFEVEYTKKFLEDYMKKGDSGAGSGENYSRMVWAFFMFQKWYENYMV